MFVGVIASGQRSDSPARCVLSFFVLPLVNVIWSNRSCSVARSVERVVFSGSVNRGEGRQRANIFL